MEKERTLVDEEGIRETAQADQMQQPLRKHAEEQAAAALDELHPDATPAERARKVKKMQRKVGNRRLAKMLAAGSDDAAAKAAAGR